MRELGEGELVGAKKRLERKTQFILSNWLHLSKHQLFAQWQSQCKTILKTKMSNPIFSYIQETVRFEGNKVPKTSKRSLKGFSHIRQYLAHL